MRIGLVTDTYLPDINGVVSSTVTLKNALEKAGHTVFVITNHAGSKIEYEGGVLRLPGFRLKSLYGYKVSSPINLGASEYLEQMNLDVLHLQTNFGVGLYGQFMGKNLNIPMVDTYHTMYTDYTHYINPNGYSGIDRVSKDAIKAASRKVCNNVQAVIAPSEKTRDALLDYGVIAPIYVIPTGLDLDRFMDVDPCSETVRAIRAQVSSDPQDRILLFLGRIAKEKSLEMPIEAIAGLNDPHIHLAIVGGGPDEDYYRELVDSLHARDRIHFLGVAAPDQVGQYYTAFDAFVSASLSETQGMTYLEAMAAGRMVFGRRDEVLEDLLEEGVTGFAFDTPEELCAKLDVFLSLDEATRAHNAQKAREKIRPYTADSFAYAVERVYEQAIEDYANTFEVEKIRFSDDYVFLTLERDASKDDIRLMMPLEDFFDLKISLQTKLDGYMVRSYLDLQSFYLCMYKTRQRLTTRDMSSAQVVRYCTRKLGADEAIAWQTAHELESLGLINDRNYAFEKAEYYHSIGNSLYQIDQKLYKAGIPPELIAQACDALSGDQELSNAKALARRLARSLKTQSVRQRRRTIMQKLISRGYSVDAAREASEELEFEEDSDSDALAAAYARAQRLYASKAPQEKRQKIKAYCLRQGFDYAAVQELLESEAL